MAVDDVVRTIRDIRTFDPKTLLIRDDGIPEGSLGTIVLQNDADRFISVQFEFIRTGLQDITKIVGVFGEGIPDTIEDSLEFVTVEPAPDLLATIQEESTLALESRDDLALQSEAPLSAQDVEPLSDVPLRELPDEAAERAREETERLFGPEGVSPGQAFEDEVFDFEDEEFIVIDDES